MLACSLATHRLVNVRLRLWRSLPVVFKFLTWVLKDARLCLSGNTIRVLSLHLYLFSIALLDILWLRRQLYLHLYVMVEIFWHELLLGKGHELLLRLYVLLF